MNNYEQKDYEQKVVNLPEVTRKNKIAASAVALMKKGGKLVKNIKDYTGIINLSGLDTKKLAIKLDEVALEEGSSFENQIELQNVIGNLGNDVNNIGEHMQKMYEKKERKEQKRNFVILSAKNFSKEKISYLKFMLVHFDAYSYTKEIQAGIELAFSDLANNYDASEFVSFRSQLFCIAYYEVLKAYRANEEFNQATSDFDMIKIKETIRRNVFSNLIEKISNSETRKDNLNQMEEETKQYCDSYVNKMNDLEEKQNLTSNVLNIPEQIRIGFNDAITEYFNSKKIISAEYFHEKPESSLGYILMKLYLQTHLTEGIDFVNKEALFLKVYEEVLKNNSTVQQSMESKNEQYPNDFMEITKNVNSLYQQLYDEKLDENSKKSAGKVLNELYNSIKNDEIKLKIYNAALDTCKSQLVSGWKKELDESQIQLDSSNLLFLAVERELADRELEASKLNHQEDREEVITTILPKEEIKEEKIAELNMDKKSIVADDLSEAIGLLKKTEEVTPEELMSTVEQYKENVEVDLEKTNELLKEAKPEDRTETTVPDDSTDIISEMDEETQFNKRIQESSEQIKKNISSEQPKEIKNQIMRVNDAIETIILETTKLLELQSVQKENAYITEINTLKNKLYEAAKENIVITRKYDNQEAKHSSELEKIRTEAQSKLEKMQQKSEEEILNKDKIITEKEREVKEKDELLSAALTSKEKTLKDNKDLTVKISSLETENSNLSEQLDAKNKENENLKMRFNQILSYAQGDTTMQNKSETSSLRK